MLYNKTDGEIDVPGTTVLAPKVAIHPYNMVNVMTGIRMNYCGMEAELGYGCWTRRALLRLGRHFVGHEVCLRYGVMIVHDSPNAYRAFQW